MRDRTLLLQLQALPLGAKVLMSQQRIREWYTHWNGDVVISFSGGKDSTVLAHLVHDMYPNVPMVFANTGLEYPEIQAFARKMGAEFVRPKMSFSEVISTYGYPIIGKEVAEAIHFARRIVSIGGGYNGRADTSQTSGRRRRELEGRRDNELLSGTARENGLETSKSNGQHSSTPPHKTRNQKDQASQGVAHGEKLIGETGDEKQSPG